MQRKMETNMKMSRKLRGMHANLRINSMENGKLELVEKMCKYAWEINKWKWIEWNSKWYNCINIIISHLSFFLPLQGKLMFFQKLYFLSIYINYFRRFNNFI